jgi:hypothetical protein
MSFDRPGLGHPGQRADEVEIEEDLESEGLEFVDGEVDGLDHGDGGRSAGPQPNPPRRPPHAPGAAGPETGADSAGHTEY